MSLVWISTAERDRRALIIGVAALERPGPWEMLAKPMPHGELVCYLTRASTSNPVPRPRAELTVGEAAGGAAGGADGIAETRRLRLL